MPETSSATDTEAESGFLKMSHTADAMAESDESRPANTKGASLFSEISHVIGDEIAARPIQSLAWAATAGMAFGLWVAARSLAPRSYSARMPFRLPLSR